jgi:hypothetical protein
MSRAKNPRYHPLHAEADVLTEQIRPLLEGHGPMVQSIVLADLVSAWLAGHVAHEEGVVRADATAEIRDMVLENFIILVRQLTSFHHDRIMEENKGLFHDERSKNAQR